MAVPDTNIHHIFYTSTSILTSGKCKGKATLTTLSRCLPKTSWYSIMMKFSSSTVIAYDHIWTNLQWRMEMRSNHGLIPMWPPDFFSWERPLRFPPWSAPDSNLYIYADQRTKSPIIPHTSWFCQPSYNQLEAPRPEVWSNCILMWASLCSFCIFTQGS